MWKTCQTYRGTTVIARLRHRVQPTLKRGFWLLMAVSVGFPVVLALTGSLSSGPRIRLELGSTDERTLDQGESTAVTYTVGDILDAIVKQGATPEEAVTFLRRSLPTRRGSLNQDEVNFQERSRSLVIRTTQLRHEQIARRVADYRRCNPLAQVRTELMYIEVPNDIDVWDGMTTLQSEPHSEKGAPQRTSRFYPRIVETRSPVRMGLLNAEQSELWLDRVKNEFGAQVKFQSTPTMMVQAARTASILSGGERPFFAGFTTSPEGMVIPRMGMLEAGVGCQLRVVPHDQVFDTELLFERSEFQEDVLAKLHIPGITRQCLESTVQIPAGSSLLLMSRRDDKPTMYLLVRLRVASETWSSL